MNTDAVLGVFIRQFADRTLTLAARADTMCSWWLAVAKDLAFPQSVLDEVMHLPSYELAYETEGGLLKGFDPSEPQKRAAVLWAGFLWRVFRAQSSLILRAWSAVKTAALRRWANDEPTFDYVLYQEMPHVITRIIEAATALTDDQKTDSWVRFDYSLPNGPRQRSIDIHRKEHPSFTKD